MRARIGCRKARQLKWRFLDRTLDNATYAQVEEHLRVCIPCRHDYTLSAQALEALKKGVDLSPELRKALERPRSPVLRLALGVSLIMLVLVGSGGYLWQSGMVNQWLARSRPEPVATDASPNPGSRPIHTFKMPVSMTEQVQLMPGVGESSEQVNLPAEPKENPDSNAPTPPPIEAVLDASRGATPPPNPPAPPEPRPSATESPKPAPAPPAQARPVRPRQKHRPAQSAPRTTPPAQTAPPPEGTVEVYDESGQLIKREQLPTGGRR